MPRKLLTNGNAFKRTDGRWCGVVWFMDERGERKSFSETTNQEVNKKMTDYIATFHEVNVDSSESAMRLQDCMQSWIEVFKFPSVERNTYDRYECTARHQVYPHLGDKIVSDITSAHIKTLLNSAMNEGYAYTTVKKSHQLLNEFFHYLSELELIPKNPVTSAPMIKKICFMAAQGKEDLSTCETAIVFTEEEIDKLKQECFRSHENGKRIYQQAAAYLLILNTDLRAGELLGLLNRDIDTDHRVLHLRQGGKEIERRHGTSTTSGREIKVEKLKSASRKQDIPLNATAHCHDSKFAGGTVFQRGFSSGLRRKGRLHPPRQSPQALLSYPDAAGIEQKGLHALRHQFSQRHSSTGRHHPESIPKQAPTFSDTAPRRSPRCIM